MNGLEKKRKSIDTSNKDYAWTLIESYFANKHLNRLVRHQLESYNHWITIQLPKTIDMFNPVRIHSDQFKVLNSLGLFKACFNHPTEIPLMPRSEYF